jgi:hypothetical protein
MDEGQPSEFEIALEKTPAPSPDVSPELALIFRIEDETGTKFRDVPKVVSLIERAFEAAGDQRGGDCLKRMAQQLEGTAAGEALRRVITGSTETLRDAAARAGCSHIAIFKQEKTIRKRLGLTAAAPIES